MQELEKMLEEIEQNQVMLKPFDEEDRPTGIINVAVVKEIIRNHMNDGWIPVEERLPEDDGFYIATMDGGIVGQEEPFVGLAELENGLWVDDDIDYRCIIAWRPMPDPYNPERSTNEKE